VGYLVELPARLLPAAAPALLPPAVAPARPPVVLGDCVLDGLGGVVGGLEARAVLVPPLPKPQEAQFEGAQLQPPVV
jgi:hypothetical protein